MQVVPLVLRHQMPQRRTHCKSIHISANKMASQPGVHLTHEQNANDLATIQMMFIKDSNDVSKAYKTHS